MTKKTETEYEDIEEENPEEAFCKLIESNMITQTAKSKDEADNHYFGVVFKKDSKNKLDRNGYKLLDALRKSGIGAKELKSLGYALFKTYADMKNVNIPDLEPEF